MTEKRTQQFLESDLSSTCISLSHVEAPARVVSTAASSPLLTLVPSQSPASDALQGKDVTAIHPNVSKYSSIKTYRCVFLSSAFSALHSEKSQIYQSYHLFLKIIKSPLPLKRKTKRKTNHPLAPSPYLPGQHCLFLCDRKMQLHIFFIEF